MQINDSQVINSTNNSLINNIVTQGFPVEASQYQKTFQNIGDTSEFVNFLGYVFLPQVYPEYDLWASLYQPSPLAPGNPNQYVPGINYLLLSDYFQLAGGVRFWQVRVANQTCPDYWDTKNFVAKYGNQSECFPAWSKDFQATEPFGPWVVLPPNATNPTWSDTPDNTTTVNSTTPGAVQKYQWGGDDTGMTLDGWAYGLLGVPGWGQSKYGTTGYFVHLPTNGTIARQIFDNLVTDNFVDAATRAFVMDYTLYNPNTDLMSVCRLEVEMTPTGLMIPSFQFYTLRTSMYNYASDYARAFGEVLLVIGTIYYLSTELKQMLRPGAFSAYWRSPANVFDMLLQAMLISLFVFWFLTIISPARSEFRTTNCPTGAGLPKIPDISYRYYGEAAPCWRDMYPYAQSYTYVMTLAGFIGLIMVLKVFKFFAIDPRCVGEVLFASI